MINFTPSMLKMLRFIRDFDTMPSRREVADFMGWKHTSGVTELLNYLKYHRCVENPYRGVWQVTDIGRAYPIPDEIIIERRPKQPFSPGRVVEISKR